MIEHYKNLSLENIVEEIDGVVYTEEWRDIQGYEGMYQVSSFGRVKSLSRKIFRCHKTRLTDGNYIPIKETILKQTIRNKKIQDYRCVGLVENKKQKLFFIHTLVALTFIPNPENKKTVNHRFGIVHDNRMWFLEWATPKEQKDHAVKMRLAPIGDEHYKSYISEQTVREIKIRLRDGEHAKLVSKSLSINVQVIYNIKYGHNYKHVIV